MGDLAANDDETVCVIACQGPPRCTLQGEAAVHAQINGCVWCETHTRLPNGEWHIARPGES